MTKSSTEKEGDKSGMGFFKLLRKIKVPQYIQFWYFDSLHIVLPVLYKEECCCVCGKPIRSSHFSFECAGIIFARDRMLELDKKVRSICAAYINFRRHCALKHRDEKIGGRWRKMLDTVRSSLLYECDMNVVYAADLINLY